MCVMTKTSFLGDKPINRIGFGAMQLAGPGVFGAPSDPEGARAVLRRAVELGVESLHAPRLWPEYHDGYFAAFVRDPDGNNVEAVCHA